jgi:hypothetical protein
VRRILGVDCGARGGLGVLDLAPTGELLGVALHRTPRCAVLRNKRLRDEYDPAAMLELLAQALDGWPIALPDVEVALEAQGARPGQGVASTYRIGLGFGLWLGLVVACRVPYRVVQPTTWKRHAGLLGAHKRVSRLRAQERFPALGVIRPLDEGPAEALLIASYVAAQRQEASHDGLRPA